MDFEPVVGEVLRHIARVRADIRKFHGVAVLHPRTARARVRRRARFHRRVHRISDRYVRHAYVHVNFVKLLPFA